MVVVGGGGVNTRRMPKLLDTLMGTDTVVGVRGVVSLTLFYFSWVCLFYSQPALSWVRGPVVESVRRLH